MCVWQCRLEAQVPGSPERGQILQYAAEIFGGKLLQRLHTSCSLTLTQPSMSAGWLHSFAPAWGAGVTWTCSGLAVELPGVMRASAACMVALGVFGVYTAWERSVKTFTEVLVGD